MYAYLTKVGDCTEYSNLFVALARAAGIPAKVIAGNGYSTLYTVAGTAADFSATRHAWAIFYLPGYGWVPVDGVWPTGKGSFAKADYSHIAGAATDGFNALSDGEISWPGPGSIKTTWKYERNRPVLNQDMVSLTSGKIVPEVMFDVKVVASPQISPEGTMVLTVTTQNLGVTPVQNLLIDLGIDNKYFEIVGGELQSSLLSAGDKWVSPITVSVKDEAYGENIVLSPKVTFDATYGGAALRYLARGELTLLMPEKRAIIPLELTEMILLILVFILAIVSGVLVARR